MTACLVLVEHKNVLAHWQSECGKRRLGLEDSYLADPAPIPEKFGAARRKSFQIIKKLSVLKHEGFV